VVISLAHKLISGSAPGRLDVIDAANPQVAEAVCCGAGGNLLEVAGYTSPQMSPLTRTLTVPRG